MGQASHPACRACGRENTARPGAGWLLCRPCWRRAPDPLRAAAITSYRRRAGDPAAWDEALAGVLLWCNDQQAVPSRDRRQ